MFAATARMMVTLRRFLSFMLCWTKLELDVVRIIEQKKFLTQRRKDRKHCRASILLFVLAPLREYSSLTNAVGAALPNDDELAIELIREDFDLGFVGDQRAILF